MVTGGLLNEFRAAVYVSWKYFDVKIKVDLKWQCFWGIFFTQDNLLYKVQEVRLNQDPSHRNSRDHDRVPDRPGAKTSPHQAQPQKTGQPVPRVQNRAAQALLPPRDQDRAARVLPLPPGQERAAQKRDPEVGQSQSVLAQDREVALTREVGPNRAVLGGKNQAALIAQNREVLLQLNRAVLSGQNRAVLIKPNRGVPPGKNQEAPLGINREVRPGKNRAADPGRGRLTQLKMTRQDILKF